MRRRNRLYYNRNTSSSSIMLAEFIFYNKQKKIVNEDVLLSIRNRLLTEPISKVYWTNEEFANAGVGFKIWKRMLDDKTQINIKIMDFCFSFTPEQFMNCKEIIDNKLFIHCDLTNEQLNFLEDIKINIYDFDEPNIKTNRLEKVITNWNDIVDMLITSKSLNSYEERDRHELETYGKDVNLLFDDINLDEKTYKVYFEGYSSPNGIRHIRKVIEKRIDEKNYRIALFTRVSHYSYTFYGMEVISENDDIYNFIDEERVWLHLGEYRDYFFDIILNEYENGELVLNLDLIKRMKSDLNEILGDKKVITPQIYRFYADRVMRFEQHTYERLSAKEKAILVQYQKLLDMNRMVKIDSVFITKNKIALNGEAFVMTFDVAFLNVMDNLQSIKNVIKKDDVLYNFNMLYENLLKLSVLKIIDRRETREKDYKEFISTSFSVNGMKVTVSKSSNRIKINDVFCRIDDVFHILSKLICYNNINEFNEYVKEVSYIGVEWKKMISNGIALEISNSFFNLFKKVGKEDTENLYLRFSLLWDADDRRKIYLLLNGKRYWIRYKGKFKQMFNMPRQRLSMSKLKAMLDSCIEGLDDDMIIDIVGNAVKEAKIIKSRGLMLVKDTIKEIDAKDTKIEIKGQEIFGYAVVGRYSKAKYFICKNDLSVYKYVEGSWNRRCVVDDHRKQRIFEDRLANRLVNIFNEPKKIFTLHNV